MTVTVILAALLYLLPVHFEGDHAALNAWVSGLRNRNTVLCCDLDDGTLLSEPDWVTQDKPESHFRVHIHENGMDEWVDVPDEKLVDGANLAGHALVWLYYSDGHPRIRCFMPGAMT